MLENLWKCPDCDVFCPRDIAVWHVASHLYSSGHEHGIYMHPHMNCPYCNTDRSAQLVELTLWMRDHASQSHQVTMERLLKVYSVTKKETV